MLCGGRLGNIRRAWLFDMELKKTKTEAKITAETLSTERSPRVIEPR